MIRKIKIFINIFVIIILFLIIGDIFFKIKGHGYNDEFNESQLERYVYPYDMFRSKPNVLDHNSHGFRGPILEDYENKKIIKIGFFGGSTGYFGNPTIPNLIQKNLKKNGIENVVFNFSSVASNHSQHIHRMVQFLEWKFDLIIFYGGGNESLGYYYYDTRPGNPYNFFIRNELSPLKHSLIRYSSIFGKIDKISGGAISGYKKMIEYRDRDYDKWINEISNDYIKKLNIAKRITNGSVNPEICKKTIFLPIIQPIKLDFNLNREDFKKNYPRLKKLVDSIILNKEFETIENNLNLTNFTDFIKFSDELHILQESKPIVAKEISSRIEYLINNKCLF